MINLTSQEKRPLHIPVMLSEVLEYLDLQENGVYIDGTVGAGGHAKSILGNPSSSRKVIGLDRDAEALKICNKQFYEKAPVRAKKNAPDWDREMVIDHDHRYSKKDFKNNSNLLPRGMLCNKCNLLLGIAKDDIQRLQSCIDYLNDKNIRTSNKLVGIQR